MSSPIARALELAQYRSSESRRLILHLSSHAGAQRLNISAEQTYVPCHDRACEILNITQPNYSVIAGHFGFRELEEAGIKDFDCLFNIREPVDRSISCLMHFYYERFRDSSRWSAEVFKQKVMTEAVKEAACYNDAVRMLISDPWLQEQALLEASKREEGSSEMIIEAALASLQRCVIVDLSDVSNDEDWSTQAPEFLAAWFPWCGKSKIIPLSNVPRLSRRTYGFMRMPHRLIQVLEEVNDLDTVVFREALQVMTLQKEALQSNTHATDEER